MKISNTLLLILFPILLSAQSQIELIFPETHYAEAVAYTPDEKMLLSIGSGLVKFWETTDGHLLRTVPLDDATSTGFRNTRNLTVSADGQWAALTESEQVFLLNLNTLQVQNKIATGDAFEYAVFTPDGTGIMVAGHEGSNLNSYFVKRIEVATGAVSPVRKWVAPSLGTHFIGNLSFNAAGNRLLVYDALMGSWMIDLNTNRLVKATEAPLCLHSFLPNGHILATTGENDSKYNLEEIDPATWKPVRPAQTVFTGENGVEPQFGAFIVGNSAGKMLIYNSGEYCRFDAQTFELSEKQAMDTPELGMINQANICVSPDGKSFVQGLSMRRFDYATGALRQKFGIMAFHASSLTNMGNTGNVMLDDRILTFDPSGFRVQRFQTPAPDAATVVRINEEGSVGLIAVDGSGLFAFPVGERDFEYYPIDIDGKTNIRGLRIFEGAGLIGIVCSDEVLLMDIAGKSIRHRILMGEGANISVFERGEDYYCDLSPDGKKFIFMADDPGSDEDLLCCYDLDGGKMLWQITAEWIGNLRFTDEGKSVVYTTGGDVWHKLDAAGGELLASDEKMPETEWYTNISPSNKIAATRLNNENNDALGRKIALYDMIARKQTGVLEGHKSMIWNVMFLRDERYLMTQAEDFRIWDVQTKQELARIVLFEDSEDWLVLAPDGRFDASPGALQVMYYVKDRRIIPLESLYEGFYTPNLLTQLWAGGTNPSPAPSVDINKLKTPPTVKILFSGAGQRNLEVSDDAPAFEVNTATATVQIQAECDDDRIVEIRLYLNDKLVETTTRNLVVEDDTLRDKHSKAFVINLLPGDNHLRAVALNSQRTESLPDEIMLRFTAPKAEEKKQNGITLYILAVGINIYKNPKYNLNYAVADAAGFRDAVSKNCGKIVSSCQQYYMTNEQAIKGGITGELDKIAALAKPQDVFVLYYAGHGVVSESNQTFYLVPHDVTQLYGNDGALAQKGLSANELRAFSQKIKAQKQLFILDACQSGGALSTVATRGAAEEKAIAQLARSTGTHWLTSAGSEQFAGEFAQLGHGIFTYALLEGLNGAADGNSDGKVTVGELDAYLQDQVPELTKKYRGTPQFPSSYGFGQDFPVSIRN